jgi:hypothetical protein
MAMMQRLESLYKQPPPSSNTVPGQQTNESSTQAVPLPSIAPPADEKPPQSAGVPPDIQKFLERWQTSLLRHDLEAQVDCYAPVVEVFFRQSNVSQNESRTNKLPRPGNLWATEEVSAGVD